jgi:hypothetical protein
VDDAGALCAEGEMDLLNCHVRSNSLSGIAVEGGTLSISSSKIEASGLEGMLLQGNRSATVVDNEVWDNGSHGIIIGYDATRRFVVRGNYLHHNRGLGLFNGAPKNKKITLEGNKESQNGGLPPNQPAMNLALSKNIAATKKNPAASKAQKNEWARRVNKLGGRCVC